MTANDRSILADWVAKSTTLREALVDAIARHVWGGSAIFADDARIKLQARATSARGRPGLSGYRGPSQAIDGNLLVPAKAG